jgi:hypothetical protein
LHTDFSEATSLRHVGYLVSTFVFFAAPAWPHSSAKSWLPPQNTAPPGAHATSAAQGWPPRTNNSLAQAQRGKCQPHRLNLHETYISNARLLGGAPRNFVWSRVGRPSSLERKTTVCGGLLAGHGDKAGRTDSGQTQNRPAMHPTRRGCDVGRMPRRSRIAGRYKSPPQDASVAAKVLYIVHHMPRRRGRKESLLDDKMAISTGKTWLQYVITLPHRQDFSIVTPETQASNQEQRTPAPRIKHPAGGTQARTRTGSRRSPESFQAG